MAYLNDIIAATYKHVSERLGAFRVISSDVNGETIRAWGTNDLDDFTTTNVTYVGQEDSVGVWRIIKIDETGNYAVYTYAALVNNPTLTDYATAWAARVTAVYNGFSDVF